MQNKKVNKASTDVKLTKAPDVKAEVKESVKEAAKKVENATKKAEAAAETTVKKAEAAAETTAKKVEAKAETAAKTTAKKAVKKAVKEPAKTELIVEFQGNAASIANLEDKVKAQFVAEGHRAGCIKTLNIYIKPEDYKAYYVINDKFTGSVDLF